MRSEDMVLLGLKVVKLKGFLDDILERLLDEVDN